MAVFPFCINATTFEIELLDKPGTVMDPDYREAESYYVRKKVTVVGQICAQKGLNGLERTATGDANPSTTRIIFRWRDLAKAGLSTLHKGDRLRVVHAARPGACPEGKQPLPVLLNVIRAVDAAPFHGRSLYLYVDVEQDRKVRGSV